MQAHEPYLQLTATADGTFTAEAGFSDGASVEGLPIFLRARATGETLGEHKLPASGKLTLPIPAVPYRVTFDGGPGHKLSKIGPEPIAAQTMSDENVRVSAPPQKDSETPLSPTVHAEASPTVPVDSPEMRVTVAVIFLLTVLSFGLGYIAGRRGTRS